MPSPIAYHLIPADVWLAADPAKPLRVGSLEDEGFVHLTHRLSDLADVANALYRDDPRPHVVLTIRLASLTSPWRYDGDERYPHVYGPLGRRAIIEAQAAERSANGTFLLIDRQGDPESDSQREPDAESDPDEARGDALFDAAIDAAVDRLPALFAAQLESVAIVVEDEATPEQLALVGAHGLLGLYQGVPRTRFGVDNVPIPSKITLFRGPLSRQHPGREALIEAITDTLYHEIAHHLGISDDRLRELRSGAGHHG
ncbi:MAG TPA: DUF952 domain-containing protein [Candidatus Limnocylindrales bacterium]|nr:DUF952 domain-containing protein [Candidatus Limnocylindrales bacterium]